METTEERQAHYKVRMPLTPADTLFVGNRTAYEVRRVEDGSYTNEADFRIKQIYGKRPEKGEAYVLSEKPQPTLGIFLIERFTLLGNNKVVSFSLSSTGAHKKAHKHALNYARERTKTENLGDVVDLVDEDMVNLRKDMKELDKRYTS